MATLTTSWTSYASASQTVSGQTVTFYLEARYSSQSTTNNTSTVYTRLRSTINGALRGTGYEFTCTYCNKRSGTGIWTFENEVIISSDAKTITHNTDGTKSISLSATAKNTYWNINKSMSVTVSLPKINRLATVTSASDFTDEENPTLSFDNPVGFTVKPYLNFYDNNNTLVYQLYRNTSITSPYTWVISNEERTALRNATNQQTSYRVQVGVDTYNGDTKLGANSIAKVMSYVNATPSQLISRSETNQKVINLLSDAYATTIIQNASQISVSCTPSAEKGATIVSSTLYHDDKAYQTITTSPYNFNTFLIKDNAFSIVTTDSRGFTVTTNFEYTNNYIEYSPIDIISFSFERYSPTSANIILNSDISYKQTTFNNTANVPTIKWKATESGTLNTLSSGDYTIDTTNNKIIISNSTLTNALAYNVSDNMYLYVEDLLTEDSDYRLVTKGIPTIEAGEHDFQVNGDLYIADQNRENAINVKEKIDWLSTQKVLWTGQHYMNGGQSVDLSDTPLSSQPHGIVLIWSAYESGQAKDWDWVCNFIPKKFVDVFGTGNGMLFNMNTTTYGSVGSKYLYISNASITGHNNNEATGTASGITYKNNHWVLRYVIGV